MGVKARKSYCNMEYCGGCSASCFNTVVSVTEVHSLGWANIWAICMDSGGT